MRETKCLAFRVTRAAVGGPFADFPGVLRLSSRGVRKVLARTNCVLVLAALGARTKWVYGNPWPFLVGIRRSPAYHVDYTTGPKGLICGVSLFNSTEDVVRGVQGAEVEEPV